MYIEASEKNEISLIASYVMNIVLFGIQFSYFENNHLIPIILSYNVLQINLRYTLTPRCN